MKFNYKSNDFDTMTQCKKEIATLKKELCNKLGLEREQFKLQNGLVVLYGYSDDIKDYAPLSHTIGNFNEKLKSELWSSYYVACNVETK